MNKEKNLQPMEMIRLEEWLIDNKDKTLTLSEYIEIFSKMTEVERNYIMMAYLMPKKEIDAEIEFYDNQKIPILITREEFISKLSMKYSVDIMTIVKRIHQIRMVNDAKKTINNTKKIKKYQK